MGFIPKITCRQCGRQYSGIYKKCPHCGFQRGGASTRTAPASASTRPGSSAHSRAESATRWQLIFGVILLVAVVASVIVLISVSLGGREEPAPSPSPSETVEPSPSPTPTPTPTPVPTPTVTSITIGYYGDPRTGFACNVGSETPMDATVYPTEANEDVTVEWSSSDESIIIVTADSPTTCVVTGISSGWAKLYATCGAVTAECDVWVR